MEWIEFVVVLIVKPGAPEVVEQHVGATGERKGVDHELLDRLDVFRVWFVVEDVYLAVSDLHQVDVAGVHVVGGEGKGDSKAELVLKELFHEK